MTLIGPSSGTAGIALQRDGKIVAAGASGNLDFGIFVLVRYLGGTLHCVVPKLTGRLLRQAKRAIRFARCSPGRVVRRFSQVIEKRRVIRQHPRAHATRPAGTKVRLVVSKGKR